jgi:hypothetical protein
MMNSRPPTRRLPSSLMRQEYPILDEALTRVSRGARPHLLRDEILLLDRLQNRRVGWVGSAPLSANDQIDGQQRPALLARRVRGLLKERAGLAQDAMRRYWATSRNP